MPVAIATAVDVAVGSRCHEAQSSLPRSSWIPSLISKSSKSRRFRVGSGTCLAMQQAAIYESFAGRGRSLVSARAGMVPHVRVTSRSAGMITTVCSHASGF